MKKIIFCILSVGLVLLSTIGLTALSIFFGWIIGYIVKFLCGDFICNGLNLLCGSERFIPKMLPTIGGALGFVGVFFKNSKNNTKGGEKIGTDFG